MFNILVQGLITVSPLLLAYYLAALGHSIVEKSGVLNLAIDGAFVLGVSLAFATAIYSENNIVYSMITAAIGSLIIGLILVYTTTKLPVSHGAVGLSLMFLGYGLAGVIGIPARTIQGLTGQDIGYSYSINDAILTVVMIVILGLLFYYLDEKTKFGAMIRACGEDPLSAEALGVNVVITRLIAGVIGFTLIGLGAGAFELFYTKLWREGAGIGQGWIAFAIALSSGRHPLLGIFTASVFAVLYQYKFSLLAYGIPREFAEALPFATAIIAMIIYMATPLRRRLAPPKSLGKPFFKEERTI
ncbi:MAG: ABC transporter permease [Thermoprotei archaeon]